MKITNLGGHSSVESFVRAKLDRLTGMERSFASLFELMFSEKENVLFEKSEGYRMVSTTYGEACTAVLGKSEGLKPMLGDLAPGSVVGIHMQNSLDWIVLFWAVLRCGYRPLLMNLRLDRATLNRALADCGAAAVISDDTLFSVPTLLAKDIPCLPPSGDPVCFGDAVLLMSSGTSADLKICTYTAQEFYYQICNTLTILTGSRQIKKHYEGQLKLLTFLPFYHIFGLIAVYIWFAFFSRTLVQLNDLAPQTILNTIRRHKVTHIFAVPLFWEKVHQQAVKTIQERGEETYARFQRGLRLAGALGDVPVLGKLFSRVAFSEVRENLFGDSICFMITGGSFISAPAMEFFNAIGYHLADGYGMTEIGITSVELGSRRKILNSCSVGKPMDSVEYRISDAGELLVRGKSLAASILEGGRVTHREEWFNTHDLARCEKGRYYILGRSDDLIISPTGENLNPNLVEQHLTVPGVRGVCLIGVKEGAAGTPVLLVSVNRRISSEKLTAVEQALKERIASLQLTAQISRLVFVGDALMEEQEFKINRRRLTQAYTAGTLHLIDPAAVEDGGEDDELRRHIRVMFAAALGKQPEEVSVNADFFLDEGGSSLEYFAMIAQMQEEFSLSFPSASGRSLNSVKELYDYVKVAMEYAD